MTSRDAPDHAFGPAAPGGFGPLVAGVLLAFLGVVAFWPVVSGRLSFSHLDLRHEHLPVWSVTQRSLAAGESPFWIDGEHCGQPMLFVQEAPLFYPLTYPLLRTGRPVERLVDLFSLFHFWLAGFTAFLLLREISGDSWGALFGAVAWMLSARMVQSAIWPNAVAVCSLLPLLLLGVVRIGRGASRSGVAWVAVAGSLILLASRPQAVVGASPVVLAATIAVIGWKKGSRRAWAHLTIALAIAVALAAPSVLTSAALYPETARGSGLARADRDLLPIWFGQNLDEVFLPVDGSPRWPEAAAYPGLLAAVAFAAGLVGFLLKSRGDEPEYARALFGGLAIGGLIGLLFAFGERGPYGFLAQLPVLRGFRVPARFLTSWSLAVALGSGLFLSAWRRRSRAPAWVAAGAVAILSADLGWHALRAAPMAPATVAAAEPPLAEALRRVLGPDETGMPRRFWTLSAPPLQVVFPDLASVESARQADPLFGARGARFGLESIQGAGVPLERIDSVFARPNDRSASLGAAGALVLPPRPGQPGPYSVRRFTGLPRLLLADEAIVVPERVAVAATLDPRLDPLRTAVLEEGDPLRPPSRPSPGRARAIERRAGYLRVATEIDHAAVLVVLDSFERGWRATLDGQPAAVLRADGAFRGVRVPPGGHEVTFRYVPPLLREGLWLSAAGALTLALALSKLRLPTGIATR